MIGNRRSLHQAAEEGDIKTIKHLLTQGVNVDALNYGGDSPLHLAAKNGHSEAAKLLLAGGANIHAQDRCHHNTPLHVAAMNGRSELVTLLLTQGANIHAFDLWHRTPLYSAVLGGHIEIIKILLAYGANIHDKNSWDQTLLHLAIISKHTDDIIHFLLEQGIDMEAKDNWHKNTALHQATIGKSVSTVKLLLMKGANINTKNNHGYTPVDLAKSENDSTLQQLFHQWEGILKCVAIEDLAQSESPEITSYAYWFPREIVEDFIQFDGLGRNQLTFYQFQEYCALHNGQARQMEMNSEQAPACSGEALKKSIHA